MVTPTDHFLNVRGVTLHYLAWGEVTNPPLILLHGGSAHAHWWDHIAAVLAQDFYVLALDFRGHGDSSWANGTPAYQVEEYVADVVEFVSLLALPAFVLIGHSLGGFVALSYASTHSQQLQALVIVDIGPRIGGSRFMRLLRQMPSPVFVNEADLYERFRLLPEQTYAPTELFRHVARHSVRQHKDGTWGLKFDRTTLGREPRDLWAQLPHFHCPTLVLRGEESHTLSTTTFSEMIHLSPYVRGVEIPGAGHHVFLDQPEEFLTVVQGFIRGVKE